MSQLALNGGQTRPTIEFPTENRENPVENTQQNFQKQFASNVNRKQKSVNWNNKIQDNPNWLKQGTQLQNASASENSIQLNCYNCKKPGHFKWECPYLSQNQGNYYKRAGNGDNGNKNHYQNARISKFRYRAIK